MNVHRLSGGWGDKFVWSHTQESMWGESRGNGQSYFLPESERIFLGDSVCTRSTRIWGPSGRNAQCRDNTIDAHVEAAWEEGQAIRASR